MKKSNLAIFLALLAGCSNPYNHSLPDGESDDPKFSKVLEKLKEEERKELLAFLIRREFAKLGGEDEEITKAKTIRDALVLQEKWREQERLRQEAEELERKQQEMRAEQLRRERQERMRQMREAVSVSVIDLKFLPSNWRVGRYRDTHRVAVALENRTDRRIVGVKGVVVFSDIFGEELKRVGLSFDDGLPPRGRVDWEGTFDHNQFEPSDVKLAHSDLSKLKVDWEPEVILYDEERAAEAP